MGHTLTSSAVTLSNEGNRTQAKHELDRARDFGGDAELAAWARKWGDAALEAAADLIDGIEDGEVEADEDLD